MEYTLMHKNIPVVDLEILSDTGRIVRLFNLHTPEHLPVGVGTKDGMSRKILDDWWTGRSIPASRDGIRGALETLGMHSTALLLNKCYGLSLSDQYWISPRGSGLEWSRINFFDNDFSKDMGAILFGHEPADLDSVSLMSPDNTSDGWLRKKWIIADGKRYLMKGGSGDYQQEPYNEVIASALMRRLGISHVTYTVTIDNGKPFSLCENFISAETELIPAWRVVESVKKDNRDSSYTHLLRTCESYGIPGVAAALDRMLVLDYIILNEDRHYNNFGFVRNADTLEWIGFSPIYDSGTSLWYNTRFVGREQECKPFKKAHSEQIQLVQDWSWYRPQALTDLDDEIMDILPVNETIDEDRRSALAGAVAARCRKLERLASGE